MPQELREECRLAINIFDIDRIVPTIRGHMGLLDQSNGGNLDTDDATKMSEKKENEVGVPFVCSTEKAALILDNIRHQDIKAGDYPTRAYIKIGDRPWKKIASSTPLTIIEYGQCLLNPKVFPIKLEPPLPMSKPPRRFL